MMVGDSIRLGVLLLGCLAANSFASEILVHGKVVRVVPINTTSRVLEHRGDCEPARPPAAAGLVSLLDWDLRASCRTISRNVDVVEGYRVYYEWDDRVYDTVMTKHPNETIPLRVNLR
jgi:uncharacterized protein YcfJ